MAVSKGRGVGTALITGASSGIDPNVFTLPMVESPATRLANVVATGSYALTLVWEDGHDYGIYNWHYLRALCPCEEDRKRFGQA